MVTQKCKFKVARTFAGYPLPERWATNRRLLLRVAPRSRDNQKDDAGDSTDGCYQHRQH